MFRRHYIGIVWLGKLTDIVCAEKSLLTPWFLMHPGILTDIVCGEKSLLTPLFLMHRGKLTGIVCIVEN